MMAKSRNKVLMKTRYPIRFNKEETGGGRERTCDLTVGLLGRLPIEVDGRRVLFDGYDGKVARR